jgi:hypothetical protein
MQKKTVFSTINDIYTGFVEMIVGDIPIDDEEFKVLQKGKDIRFKEMILALGTPKTDSILYEKLVKKERREAKKIKTLKKLAKLEKKTKKALKKKKFS